jgi:hypothetical protein
MRAPILYRWRNAIALGFAVLPNGVTTALEPPLKPVAGATTTREAGGTEVELYYGTVKVGTVHPTESGVSPASTVVTAEAMGGPVAPIGPVGEAMVDSLHAVRNSAWKVSSALVSYLARAEDRAKTPLDPHTFILTSPGQLSPLASAPAASQQPTVVVIRESGSDSRSAAMEGGGITLGTGSLIGLGIGVLGIGIGFAGWRRRMAMVPAVAPPVMDGNSVLLMGKYNAGPRRETAERFEIGQSYQTVQAEKKKTEAEKQQAVLEHILSQNIALHAQLAETVDNVGTNPDLPLAESIVDESPLPIPA